MIRSRDLAFRAALAAAPMEARCAAFEAVMLVRVAAAPTDPPPGSTGRPPSTAPARRLDIDRQRSTLLAEFDSGSAAQRLAAAVAYIAPVAEIRSHGLGGRHRYEIHQVTVPRSAEALVRGTLARAGCNGALALCSVATDRGITARRDHHRSLAVAAWRAALLAAGPGRGPDLTVRVADRDTTRVLVRAASRLGVPVRAALRPGGHLLSVSGPEPIEVLVAATTGATGVPVAVTSLAG